MPPRGRNIEGERFGNWLVLHEVEGKRWSRRFACRCNCGAEHLMYANNLARAARLDVGCRSCSGAGRPRIDRTGMRFGRWTIVREVGRYGTTIIYMGRCDCGNESKVYYSNLLMGASTQCQECHYRAMVKWVPGTIVGKNVVLARKGKKIKIACSHCGKRRWLRSISSHNAGCVCARHHPPLDTHGRMFTLNGETHNMAGWARKLGISREAVRLRLERGMQLEMALTAPRTHRSASA